MNENNIEAICSNCIFWTCFRKEYEDEPDDSGICRGNRDMDDTLDTDTCGNFKPRNPTR